MAKLSPHFDEAEFDCRCGRLECDAPAVSMRLVELLEALRAKLGRSVIVTSGVRCAYHNRRVGGAADSQHVKGLAADIAVAGPTTARLVDKLADELGAGGIGIAANFVHIDMRPRAPGAEPVRWSYGPKAVA